MSRYAYRGRHRKHIEITSVRSAALAAGAVAAVMTGSATPASAAPTDDPWYKLRMCESGGNYRIDTGNGYYGAYQFNLGTWRAYGGTGLPSKASPAEQDYRAKLLYRARGWAPWPACSRKLGLRNDPAYGKASPVARTTITAPSTVFNGGAITLTGTAAPNSRVRLYYVRYGKTKYTLLRRVAANSAGRWTSVERSPSRVAFFATANGARSAKVTTRVLFRSSISGPAIATVNRMFTVTGRARPNARAVVFARPTGRAAWRPRAVHTDRTGRFVARWRAGTDMQYFVRSDVASAVRTTKVATRVRAGAATVQRLAGSPGSLSLTGTAKPSSRVTVWSCADGVHWGRAADLRVSRTGGWRAVIRMPANSFRYTVKASNGTRTPVYAYRAS